MIAGFPELLVSSVGLAYFPQCCDAARVVGRLSGKQDPSERRIISAEFDAVVGMCIPSCR